MPVAFKKTSTSPIRFERELGRCIGWACFSKKDGEDYVDLHGDHFPDDELLKAVDGLMKRPLEEREINVDHVGKARGTIVTAFALTEDIAKSVEPKIDTGGTYGVLVSFEPDAELKKSIVDGEMICLSIEGKAYDVEEVAKSAEGVDVAATKHKRTMRKIELTKLAVVAAGAHEGAKVAILKSAQPTDAIVAAVAAVAKAERPQRLPFVHLATPIVKRTPALTTSVNGHQHKLDDVTEKDGYTSWESMPNEYGSYYGGHSHPWVRGTDGTIVIGEAYGHSHTLDTETTTMPTDIEKAQADLTNARAEIAKRDTRIATLTGLVLAACALPPDQAAFAKRLGPAELEGFLGKTEAERAELAKPVYKSTSTGEAFYASDDSRLITMAKRHDADAERFEKAEQRNKALEFAKRADEEIPHLRGTAEERGALLAAAEGIADEAVRKTALEALKSASEAMAPLFKKVGHGGGAGASAGGKSAEEQLHAAHAEFAKKLGKRPEECASEFAATEEGQRLFDAAYNN